MPNTVRSTVLAVIGATLVVVAVWLDFADSPDRAPESVGTPQQARGGASRVADTSGFSPAAAGAPRSSAENGRNTDANAGLSIAGSVLNLQGQRLADIEVVASARRGADGEAQAGGQRARSDASGKYRFDGLEDGDYLIRNVETSVYPSTRINVRSGTDGADLVIAARQELWVFGTVTDGEAPLPGVQVLSERDPSNATYSNVDGSFGLFLALQNGNEQEALEFLMDGFSDVRLPLRSVDPFATELRLDDVRLTRIEGLATVRGRVVSGEQPVAGARLLLHANDSNENYTTESDAGGNFSFAAVVIGAYSLRVVPKRIYQDYTDPALQVGISGVDLLLALTPLQGSRFRGQMVDADGIAIPGFSLWLTNVDATGLGSQPIVGDAQGRFDVTDVPAGRLALTTHSEPRFRVSGIKIDENNRVMHELVLDLGNHMLEGRVTDQFSNAVPGARISIVWSHENDGVASYSTRNSVSDTSGYFLFTQLGPGVHIVNVSAAGFERHRADQDVTIGGELQVRLRASGGVR